MRKAYRDKNLSGSFQFVAICNREKVYKVSSLGPKYFWHLWRPLVLDMKGAPEMSTKNILMSNFNISFFSEMKKLKMVMKFIFIIRWVTNGVFRTVRISKRKLQPAGCISSHLVRNEIQILLKIWYWMSYWSKHDIKERDIRKIAGTWMESDLNGGFTNRAEVAITTEEELKDSDSEDESILSDDQFCPNHLKITNSSCRILWKKKWKNNDARKLN